MMIAAHSCKGLFELKRYYDLFVSLKNPSQDHAFWVAEYNILCNQLKSRNHKGTYEQLEKAVGDLIKEAENINQYKIGDK